jgi:hypothetical protein
MGIRKLGEQNIRKLTKLGKETLAVTLPVEYLRALKWREKQNVVVEKHARHLVIKDWKK